MFRRFPDSAGYWGSSQISLREWLVAGESRSLQVRHLAPAEQRAPRVLTMENLGPIAPGRNTDFDVAQHELGFPDLARHFSSTGRSSVHPPDAITGDRALSILLHLSYLPTSHIIAC
jgi:hypothetical protein